MKASGSARSGELMQAIAVTPRQADSVHLREVPRPRLADLPNPRAGARVRVIRVGVDGTDEETIGGKYGSAPDGDDYLIIGHENLGRVIEVGPDVPDWLTPGQLVVATVRRPGSSIYDRIGMQDMTTDDAYRERGITGLHGFLTELYVEDATFIVPIPESIEPVAVLLEPLTIAEKVVRQVDEIQRRLRVWRAERACVLGAGTVGLLATLALRLRGVDVTVYSRRRPPYLNGELVEAIGGRYVSSQDATLADLARSDGPFDLMLDATGFSPLAFEAAGVLGKNGVLVLVGVTAGERSAEVPTDRINREFVLGNKVMIGVVNASRDDFVAGAADLIRAEAFHPGWLGRLLTTPIAGLEAYAEMLAHLRDDEAAIKVFVEIDGRAGVD